MTLDDVARAAGVSRMTASYTFSRPDRVAARTREKVLAAADRLGFRGPDPSGRLLRTGGLRSLGLVLGESLEYVFEDPEAARFVGGMARECSAAGYGLTIIPTTGEEPDRAHIATAAVDAFVIWTTTPDDPVLDAVRETRRPAVVHGGPAVPGFALVGIDDRAAARELALAVWSDAKAPAVISFPVNRDRAAGVVTGLDPTHVSFPVTRHRLAGFHEAADLLGLDWDTIPVAVCTHNDSEGAADAAEAIRAARPDVDGLVAMSDRQALAAQDVLGPSVPLGGFDGSELARERGITSVRQSLPEQGAHAARIALGIETGAATSTERWTLIRA